MGLSNFPSAGEGMLPVLVMNTVMSVTILKNLLRTILQMMGISPNLEDQDQSNDFDLYTQPNSPSNSKNKRGIRGISITQFKHLCERKKGYSNFALGGKRTTIECCVCLCDFGEEEEVSELSCKHFFHRDCLDKWFDNHHKTCPLCRSLH